MFKQVVSYIHSGNNEMKCLIILIFFFLMSTFNQAQDSLDTRLQMKRFGIGIDAAGVTAGPQLHYYTNGWLLGVSYGLPSSSTAKDIIKVFDRTLYLRAALSLGYISTNSSFWPLYLGAGLTYVDEKSTVQDVSGNGSIYGTSIYVGTKLLQSDSSFFSNIGVHLEIGYTFWNYTNSLFEKNNIQKEYNYPKFYYSVGACYYIF